MTATKREANNNSFTLLMEALPQIAETVKQLPEALQPRAFEALLEEFRSSEPRRDCTKQVEESEFPTKPSKETRKAKRKRTKAPTVRKDLDLRPKDKMSLPEFAEGKAPKNNYDKNVVSVYYLRQIAGTEAVGVDHVFTCYREMGWREPADLANSLQQTASKMGYLDTAIRDDIKLTPAGRNHVDLDLPRKKKV